MVGTKSGGIKAKQTILQKHGEDFFKRIGKKGGSVSCEKGFALNHELARIAGKKGGKVSKRNRKDSNEQ